MGPKEKYLRLADHLINEYSLDVDRISLAYSIQNWWEGEG